jgi:hypothetical protein
VAVATQLLTITMSSPFSNLPRINTSKEIDRTAKHLSSADLLLSDINLKPDGFENSLSRRITFHGLK